MSLTQDYTTVPGQLYACLSVVGPEAPQKNEKFGIKIRGAFSNRDEAANHAKRLQKEDPTFDIYVVDMYKWLLIPPDPAAIEDTNYTNEKAPGDHDRLPREPGTGGSNVPGEKGRDDLGNQPLHTRG